MRCCYLFILTNLAIADSSEATSASISSLVLYSDKLMRSDWSAAEAESPKAVSASLGSFECDEQAEPLETNTPSAERKCTTVSLFMLGSVIFIICDALSALGAFIIISSALSFSMA